MLLERLASEGSPRGFARGWIDITEGATPMRGAETDWHAAADNPKQDEERFAVKTGKAIVITRCLCFITISGSTR